MKGQVAFLGVKPVALSPESNLWRHAAVRSLTDHEAPLAEHQAPTANGHDFSRVPVQSQSSACPLAPRRCPFGGACHTCPTHVQAKLAVNKPGDQYEREAEGMAETVMRMPKPDEGDDECAVSNCPRTVQRRAETTAMDEAPPIVHEVLRSPGRPLDSETRAFMEPRFGCDFSQVRVHTDAKAADSARAVDALAYTVGRDMVFGAGQYRPRTGTAQRLMAHELTHTLQQSRSLGAPQLNRKPIYSDTTCDSVKTNISAAWPTAKNWVQNARTRLAGASGVASALQTHFKLDPNDAGQAGDLATVRQNFDRMHRLFDTAIDNRCTAANSDGQCRLSDGRKYAAYVYPGMPEYGITHCLPSADVGFLSRESLIETIVHEMAHLADAASLDYAFLDEPGTTTYSAMTRPQAIHNGDSHSEFAHELFVGPPTSTPLLLGLTTGALLSTGRPRWAVLASYDIRSRSGLEVFDLVGGIHGFIGLESAPSGQPLLRELGGELNLGIISRSAETRFFVDTRLGVFGTADVARQEAPRLGLSSSTLIGWGDSRFRTGINLRLLYDFLKNNNAVLIGGEFQWGP